MAYHIPVDHTGPVSQQIPMQNYLEPETVTRDSDDDSVESTSTPGSKRKGGHGSASGMLKRAVSSPNVRGLGVEALSLSAADKKRNKLGYHRTAVACGHCRRRKIRCIPAFEDTSGRCQNCIRLKKDCHFFPVDQQSVPVGRRARAGSKADTLLMEGEISASSSEPGGPPILKSSPEEQIKPVNGLIQSPLSPQETAGFPAYGEYVNTRLNSSNHSDFNPSQSYVGHHQHYDQRSQSYNIGMQPPPLHIAPESARSHNQYYPHIGGAMMTSPLHSSPQSTIYSGRTRTSGVEQQWPMSASDRSMSTTESDEAYHPYAPYRTQSYPANIRRSSEPQHITFGHRDHPEAMGGHYSQETLSRQYQDASPYGPGGGYPQQMGGNLTHMPVSTGVPYPSTWYTNPGLPYVREEDDQVHGVLSHEFGRSQP